MGGEKTPTGEAGSLLLPSRVLRTQEMDKSPAVSEEGALLQVGVRWLGEREGEQNWEILGSLEM